MPQSMIAPNMQGTQYTPRGFNLATRLHRNAPFQTYTRTPVTGGRIPIELPKTGLAAGLMLNIRGVIASVTGTPHAAGQAAILDSVRVQVNSTYDVFNLTGPQYFWGYLPNSGGTFTPLQQTTGRSAIAAGAVNLDMWVPFVRNLQTPDGLLPLGNNRTLVTATVAFAPDSIVAPSGITWTTQPTIKPSLVWFLVPDHSEDWPNLNVIHGIRGEQRQVAATGFGQYPWPYGNVITKIIHMMGYGVSAADAIRSLSVRVDSSIYIDEFTPDQLDIVHSVTRGPQRLLGTYPLDYLATSGNGDFGLLRDFYDTTLATTIETVYDASATGTWETILEEIITLPEPMPVM
jgi:hypothetical protein